MVNAADNEGLKADLAAEAKRLGFAVIGIAPAVGDAVAAARLDAWLSADMHGAME